jgi:hypothetical protein
VSRKSASTDPAAEKSIPRASGKAPSGTADERSDKSGANLQISEELIRQRAYEIYLRRGGGPGDAASDWKHAELELRAESRGASAQRKPRGS